MNKKIYTIIIISAVSLGSIWYFSTKSNGQFSNNISTVQEATESQIVELKNGETFDLTASIVKKIIAGSEVKMLAYNGTIPGPIIKVKKGAEITINFTNNTDVPTTVHSHGIRLDNKFDGVPDVTQKEVGVGESFTYKIKFPDEGIYWYHPHVREDYAQELGLYGNYIVTSPEPFYWSEVEREETLFLDDILIENGKVATFSSVADHVLMGRFGNVMLVNGTDKYNLNIKQGERVRFYVTNSANTRVFNFSIPNTRMKLVGGDNGKYEREEWVDSVLLAPSERAVVEIWFDKDGNYPILHTTPNKTYTMGNIKVVSSPVTTSYFLVARTNEDTISSIDPLRQYFDKKADKSLAFTIDMGGMGGGSHMMPDGTTMSNSGMMMGGNDSEKIEWEDNMTMMNSMSYANTVKWKIIDQDTKKENEKIDWKFKVGDKVKIKIFNDPKSMHPMQHPFHIHGQKFLILSTNGVKNTNMVWKDTTLIQKGDTVEIIVNMENLGTWMAHCHIAEHLESGMMFSFKVE
ncbi:MAG: bilirubin oxidase [Parcubacteria bacterium C7867-006]|nr:MAG: bilirubin oxidase [Parcubacteria bacterium C7867-006]